MGIPIEIISKTVTVQLVRRITLDINSLTLGQIKEIQSLVGGGSKSSIASRYVGKEVVVRSYSAGNHFGELVEYDPAHQVVVLKNARRLWRWNTNKGVSLSEIAEFGVVQANSKICTTVLEQIVAEVDEILPATQLAAETIKSAPVYVYS